MFDTYPATLVLCERRCPISSCSLWSAPSLVVVLSAKKLQGKMPGGWVGKSFQLKHADAGGVKNGVWTMSVITRLELEPSLFDCHSNPMGNLMGCIDQSLTGLSCPPPPARTCKPEVHYHNGACCAMNGLYPCMAKLTDNFVVPTYKSKTGWCIRILSQREIFAIWDVTPGLTSGLEDLA